MDFKLDTAYPWETVAAELKEIFDRIKQMRIDAGLPRDIQADPSPTQWSEHLKIWLNVKKFATKFNDNGMPECNARLLRRVFGKEFTRHVTSRGLARGTERWNEARERYKKGRDALGSRIHDAYEATERRIREPFHLQLAAALYPVR